MNLKILMYSLIVLATANGLRKNARIIGGETANASEYPHLVSLRLEKSNKHYCGGSIISNWHILTAGHCVSNQRRTTSETKIYTACTNLRSTSGPKYTIDRVHVHPKFTGKKTKSSMFEHDIAVISVKEHIQFNSCQNKINLPVETVWDKTIGVVSGWGLISLSPVEKEPWELQKASTLIIGNDECSHLVPFVIGSGHLCTINPPGIGACKGDSGSGLVANGILLGVVSFVRPCGTKEPDIYTRVYNYLDFINWILN